MPRFFDKSNLTETQARNWDHAVTEYKRVQAKNLTALSPLASEPDPAFSAFLNSGCGDEKSALFCRLLNGLPALEFPPPTSYSYPWYAVVEERGPFNVDFLGCEKRTKQPRTAIINQCSWDVLSVNDAAAEIETLQVLLSKTRKKILTSTSQSFDFEYSWTDSFFKAVQDAYQSKPAVIVKFGSWRHCELQVGLRITHANLKYAKAVIKGEFSERRLVKAGSVYDLMMLDLCPQIGQTIGKGEHPSIMHNQLVEQNKLSPAGQGGYASMALAASERTIHAAIEEFEADPTCRDWVELISLGWMLTPCP